MRDSRLQLPALDQVSLGGDEAPQRVLIHLVHVLQPAGDVEKRLSHCRVEAEEQRVHADAVAGCGVVVDDRARRVPSHDLDWVLAGGGQVPLQVLHCGGLVQELGRRLGGEQSAQTGLACSPVSQEANWGKQTMN